MDRVYTGQCCFLNGIRAVLLAARVTMRFGFGHGFYDNPIIVY